MWLCYVLILAMPCRWVMLLRCNVTLLLWCYVVMLCRYVVAMLMESMRDPNLVVMVLLCRYVDVMLRVAILLCCYGAGMLVRCCVVMLS